MTDLLLAVAAWYASGVAGYAYWSFEDRHPGRAAWLAALASGFLGPVTLIAGWLVRLSSDNTPDDRGDDDRGGHGGDDWRDGDRRLIPIRIDDRRKQRRR